MLKELRPLSGLLLLLAMLWTSSVWAAKPRTLTLTASAYTSAIRETDHNPHITATGARTRKGVVAISRDLLPSLPYGSRVTLQDLGSVQGRGAGKYNAYFKDVVFVVEDTMNKRHSYRMDVWMPDRSMALQFGVRKLKVTVLQVGR